MDYAASSSAYLGEPDLTQGLACSQAHDHHKSPAIHFFLFLSRSLLLSNQLAGSPALHAYNSCLSCSHLSNLCCCSPIGQWASFCLIGPSRRRHHTHHTLHLRHHQRPPLLPNHHHHIMSLPYDRAQTSISAFNTTTAPSPARCRPCPSWPTTRAGSSGRSSSS